jgi:hypothetical protein
MCVTLLTQHILACGRGAQVLSDTARLSSPTAERTASVTSRVSITQKLFPQRDAGKSSSPKNGRKPVKGSPRPSKAQQQTPSPTSGKTQEPPPTVAAAALPPQPAQSVSAVIPGSDGLGGDAHRRGDRSWRSRGGAPRAKSVGKQLCRHQPRLSMQ